VAGRLRVGRIGEESQDTPAAQLSQLGKIGQLAVHWRLVELEIARMDDQADGSGDAQPHAVGDRVADAKELDGKGVQVQHVCGRDGVQFGVRQQVVLPEFDFDEAPGQAGGIERRMDVAHQVGQPAHVVFVAVGDNDGPDPILALKDVVHIGDHDINAQHVAFWEHQSAVDDQQLVVILKDHHILADLSHSPEGDDFQDALGQGKLL